MTDEVAEAIAWAREHAPDIAGSIETELTAKRAPNGESLVASDEDMTVARRDPEEWESYRHTHGTDEWKAAARATRKGSE